MRHYIFIVAPAIASTSLSHHVQLITDSILITVALISSLKTLVNFWSQEFLLVQLTVINIVINISVIFTGYRRHDRHYHHIYQRNHILKIKFRIET